MPAGFAGLGKAVEADRERERKRKLAAARAERERRRRAKATAAAAAARMQDAHDRAAQVTAATKRTERSREVVAESKREPEWKLGHKRDAIENLRSFGSARRRPLARIEALRARTSAERELRSREELQQLALASRLARAGFGGGRPSVAGVPLEGAWRHVKKAGRDILYGTADLAADYGQALYGDLTERDLRTIPFRRTGRQVAKDVLGMAAFAETAIPEPKFLPEWMRREVLTVDPENVSIRRGSGKIDRDDARRAAEFWKENPILGALGVLPLAGQATRRASRGAIESSIRRAHPELPSRDVRRIAKRESRMPGYAAAHGFKGGIAPRVVKGALPEQHAKAVAATPKLERVVNAVVRGTGARAVTAPPKSAIRAKQKLARDYYGDPAGLRDLARATIVVADEKQLASVLDRLKATGAVRGARSEWSGENTLGYQHGKVWLDVDGHVVEVQITTPAMFDAKDIGGHALYERWRSLPDGPEKDRLAAQSRDWYSRTASSNLASRSSSVSSSQGRRSISKGGSVPNRQTQADRIASLSSSSVTGASGARLDRSLPTSANAELPASSVGSPQSFESVFRSAFPIDHSVPQTGVVVGRPWSRHPLGRAGQRLYDRASQGVEARFGPGAMFSTSQRAARAKERALRKDRARMEAEVVRLERQMRKGIGKLGRSRSGQEALIAALEAPRALTPRQAVELKLADLRRTLERPRTADEARARVEALDAEIETLLRPVVDGLELTGIRGSRKGGGSVLADAQAEVESTIVRAAAKPGADPRVRELAQKILERDILRERVNDPDVVFGGALADFGVAGASPAAAKRLRSQVQALERALASDRLESPQFAKALAAAETLSRQADEHARKVLGMSDEELAARRNVVARRYAEAGLLPEGVEPEARGFFPHREAFERVGSGHGGMVGIPASGSVIGRPLPGRAFERRRNRLVLYEEGRAQTDPRVLSNTVRQRARYAATLEARRYLYEQGQPIRAGQPVPEGSMLVRNPDTSPEQIPASVRAAIEQPERFAELAGRAGEFPEPSTFQAWLDTWLYRGHGPEPEWLADVANVRAVPEGVVRTLLSDVFASAPRGSLASIFGALNALARATTLYLPLGGARYVARNTPQNMIMLAMTQPRAFLQLRKSTVTLRRREPDVYAAIKAETGTVPAAAGLPELAGMRRNRIQRTEQALTQGSRRIAGALGEVSDEPWRVASWLAYAKAYGFGSKDARRRLLTSDDPAIKRVRDDIAQRVRDDMLDFDALTPAEREKLTRVFFIWAFKRAALKWPFMYLREYPERAALMSLIAAQHAREGTPGRETSVLESGRTEIGGREVDLGWLWPHVPAAETLEDAEEFVRGLGGKRISTRPLVRQFAPQYRSAVDSGGYGGVSREQVARWAVPGYTTVERIGKGGSLGEQVLRQLGATIEYIEPGKGSAVRRAREKVRAERDAVLPVVRRTLDPDDFRYVQRAYAIAERMAAIRARVRSETKDSEEYYRAVLAAEARLMGKLGVFDREDVRWLEGIAQEAPLEEVKSRRAYLVSTAYEAVYLKARRIARELAGFATS
jgi:hypothetical protein